MPSAGLAAALAVTIRVAPDVSAASSSTAIRSCEAALGPGKCRLEAGSDVATPGPPGASDTEDETWRATIVTDDEHVDTAHTAHIELRRQPGGPVLSVRDPSFSPEDPIPERWASIGVLVAAMVVAEASKEVAVPVASARPSPPAPDSVAVVRPRAAADRRSQQSLRLDVDALASWRTSDGPAEIGASLTASALFSGSPLFAGASLAGARGLDSVPNVFWVSAAALAGARVGAETATWAVELRAGGVVEYWSVGASRDGREERAGTWRGGGLAGAQVLWRVHPRWIPAVGVEGRFVAPRLLIDVSGATVEHVPEYGALVFAGLRVLP